MLCACTSSPKNTSSTIFVRLYMYLSFSFILLKHNTLRYFSISFQFINNAMSFSNFRKYSKSKKQLNYIISLLNHLFLSTLFIILNKTNQQKKQSHWTFIVLTFCFFFFSIMFTNTYISFFLILILVYAEKLL